MSHLSEDQIFDLGKKVLGDIRLSEDDVKMIGHIGECEECYRLLTCMMALMSVTDHMGQALGKRIPERQKRSAKIKLTVDGDQSSMDPGGTSGRSWSFAPPSMAGSGGDRKETARTRVIEDLNNCRTFLEYDPEKRLLTIQVDGTDGAAPKGFLRFEDGTMGKIAFEEAAYLYRAQIGNLEDGEYRLILEKEKTAGGGASGALEKARAELIRELESQENRSLEE